MQPKPILGGVRNNGTLLLQTVNDPSRSFLTRYRALARFNKDRVKEEDKTVWMAADAAKHVRQVHNSLTDFLENHPVQSGHDSWAKSPQEKAKIERSPRSS